MLVLVGPLQFVETLGLLLVEFAAALVDELFLAADAILVVGKLVLELFLEVRLFARQEFPVVLEEFLFVAVVLAAKFHLL